MKNKLIFIILLFSINCVPSSAEIQLNKIGNTISIKDKFPKIGQVITSQSNLIYKDSIFYLGMPGFKLYENVDSVYWNSAILLKYNLNGNTNKNYFLKEFINDSGGISPRLLSFNQDGTINMYSKIFGYFNQFLVTLMKPNTKKITSEGEILSDYSDSKYDMNFSNVVYQMYLNKNNDPLVFERTRIDYNGPWIFMRFNKKGEVIDTITHNFSEYHKGTNFDTLVYYDLSMGLHFTSKNTPVVLYRQKNNYIIKDSNRTYSYNYYKLVYFDENLRVNKIIRIDSGFAGVDYLIPLEFNILPDDKILMVCGREDTENNAPVYSYYAIKIDKAGKILFTKKINISNKEIIAPINSIVTSHNDIIIIGDGYVIGKQNPEKKDACILKIDSSGTLIFKQTFSSKPLISRFTQIKEISPDNYLLLETKKQYEGLEDLNFYTFIDNTSDVQETQATENIVYPNPAGDYLNIKDIENISGDIEIHNIAGKTVMQVPASSKIDIRILPAGVYYVTINGKTEKFVKK